MGKQALRCKFKLPLSRISNPTVAGSNPAGVINLFNDLGIFEADAKPAYLLFTCSTLRKTKPAKESDVILCLDTVTNITLTFWGRLERKDIHYALERMKFEVVWVVTLWATALRRWPINGKDLDNGDTQSQTLCHNKNPKLSFFCRT